MPSHSTLLMLASLQTNIFYSSAHPASQATCRPTENSHMNLPGKKIRKAGNQSKTQSHMKNMRADMLRLTKNKKSSLPECKHLDNCVYGYCWVPSLSLGMGTSQKRHSSSHPLTEQLCKHFSLVLLFHS